VGNVLGFEEEEEDGGDGEEKGGVGHGDSSSLEEKA
jgi:hypothetical protein